MHKHIRGVIAAQYGEEAAENILKNREITMFDLINFQRFNEMLATAPKMANPAWKALLDPKIIDYTDTKTDTKGLKLVGLGKSDFA